MVRPHPLRILLAEDYLINRTLAKRLPQKEGHTVTIAADGRAAIKAFEGGAFDVILIDVQIAQTERIRSSPSHPAVGG